MDSFILCVRDKVAGKDEFGIKIGPINYLRVPENSPSPLPSMKINAAKAWMDAVVAQANPPATSRGNELDIIFFVHGYNTDPTEALLRQRLVESELRKRGFSCMVVGFDWPTGGNALLYEYDRFEAQDAASSLVKGGIIPFAAYTLPNCPINVHVMAHSMGAFVVREAFRAVDKGRDSDLANDWRIGQLVLFAADISSECFALGDPEMIPVFNHCGRLTNYFSGYDEALAVSNLKNIDVDSRVGRVGMPSDTPAHEKAVDIDCGPRYHAIPEDVRANFKVIHGMVSHSWYLEDDNWYDDLTLTLQGNIDRNSIPTRKPAGANVGPNDFVLNT